MDFVKLTSVSMEVFATPIIDQLDAAGIRGRVASDDMGGVDPALAFVQGVRIEVPESDLEKAREVLAAFEAGVAEREAAPRETED